MKRRMLLAFVALTLAFAAAPAQAQFYGPPPGGPFYQPGLPPPPPGYGRGYDRGYDRGFGPPAYQEPQRFGGRISCGQGARIVASQGFWDITPRECKGRVYRYSARGRGAFFEEGAPTARLLRSASRVQHGRNHHDQANGQLTPD